MEVVGVTVLQELWNRVALQAMELVSETRDVVFGKDKVREFSWNISELSIVLLALKAKSFEAARGTESAKVALETLNSQLMKARSIIKDYKTGSRLRLLLYSSSILLEMQNVGKEIANTISSFQIANLDIALNLKNKTDKIIENLRSIEFQSSASTERIALEIENSIRRYSKNREHAVKLLEKIAGAVGASPNASLVQNELALLKQEKEEMEAQMKQAEAFQLSQLIQLLYDTEIVMRPHDEEIVTRHQKFPIDSFICQLCNEMMTDPVAILCGHSFERKAIQEYFTRGHRKCPVCRQELPALELTPNLSLQNSIEEWKKIDMDMKFNAAIPEIKSNDHSRLSKALEDVQILMHMPQYAARVAEEGLIPKLVEILKDNRLNTTATLKCLYYLAKHSDMHKEAIVEAGAVHRIVKQICKGDIEPDAIAVLSELSERENLGEKIVNTRDCIPLLVSLLNNNHPDVSQKAHKVLQNLSSNTHFVIKMAEAGHFQPFVARFNEGPHETRALMATALIKMQIKENSVQDLKDSQFIHNLVQMLCSSIPTSKTACLKSIQKLIAYPEMVQQLLIESDTIPQLLGLISYVRCDPHLKQDAAEILALMVGASQNSELQMYQGLQEIQSKHSVDLFLQLVASSDPQVKSQFLHLLLELSNKSETARNLIRSNKDATAQLFSCLGNSGPTVRRLVMKLIYCISEGHPAGVPLPPSPGKESAINTLVAILTHSRDIEERSSAAGIISQLPKDDNCIDEILYKSEALKAIHEVICSTDNEHSGVRTLAILGNPLLENTLAALLRYTEPTKPELQKQLGKLELYPSLVRVLSTGSSLAKKRTAIALAHLSQSASLSVSEAMKVSKEMNNSMPFLHVSKLFPNMSWCCSAPSNDGSLCSVHGAACSSKDTFCLIKADAVKPLVQTLSETESGVAEAALMALETLLTDHSTLRDATAAIVDSQGIVAILQLLEKGSLAAKCKALELFQKILDHTQISNELFQRSERILVQLLNDDEVKKKVALVLRQMKIFPEQSSYF